MSRRRPSNILWYLLASSLVAATLIWDSIFEIDDISDRERSTIFARPWSHADGTRSAEDRVTTNGTSANEYYTTRKMPSDLPANKSLVILIGGLRAGERAWNTLYENVLDINSADLALMTSDKETIYPNSTLPARARYVWHYKQYDDWADAVDLVRGTGWRSSHLHLFKPTYPNLEPGKNDTILFGGLKGHTRASGIIIFMIRYFLIQAIRDNGILNLYDTFVVTRTDHFYKCPHAFARCNLGDRDVIVPDGEGYVGITDRHLIASRDTLLEALDLITPLISQPFSFDFNKHHNSERWLQHVWSSKALHVKRCVRSMFTVAREEDTSRWRIAKDELPGVPGLFIKYQQEYNGTVDGCTRFHRNSRPSYKGNCMKCGCGMKMYNRRRNGG